MSQTKRTNKIQPIQVYSGVLDGIIQKLESTFQKGSSESVTGAEEGYRYQKEITLHLNIVCRENLDKDADFNVMHEVRAFNHRFDDALCQIQLSPNEICYLAIQSKHLIREFEIKETDLFFKGKSSVPFDIKRYFQPGAQNEEEGGSASSTQPNLSNNVNQGKKVSVKFILLTNVNHVLEKNYVEDISDDILNKVFANIKNKEAKIEKFTDNSETVWNNWFKSNNFDMRNFNHFFEFIKNNFIFVTNVPNVKNMIKINSDLLQNIYNADTSTMQHSFYTFVRESVMEHIEVNKQGCTKPIKKKDFEIILQNTILKLDFHDICENFPFKVSFKDEVLENIREKIVENQISFQGLNNLRISDLENLRKETNNVIQWSSLTKGQKIALKYWKKEKVIILYHEEDDDFIYKWKENKLLTFKSFKDDKYNEICQNIDKEQKRLCIKKRNLLFKCKIDELAINAFKVSQALRKDGEDDIILWSNLKEKHRNALKFWNQHDLVVMLDTDNSVEEDLRENKMLIFIKQSEELKENPLSFLLHDLTVDSRQDFLKKTIKEVELKAYYEENIADAKKRDELFRDIFLLYFQGKTLELFSQFPQYEIPEIYIKRRFKQKLNKKNKIIEEEEFFKKLHSVKYCMIQGEPGMGKSTILKKIANEFKKTHFVVQFLNLGEPDLNVEFLEEENRAKDFLKEKFLNLGKGLDKKIIKYFLSLKNHPLILIIDGFNEIMPDYEDVVVEQIKKLSSLNVQIFISGRTKCETVLQELKDNNIPLKIFTLEPFQSEQSDNKNQIEEYLDEFFKKRGFDLSTDLVKDFNKASCDFNHILANPLFLKATADIFFKSKNNQSNVEYQLNEHDVYKQILDSSFDRFLEKKGNNPEVTLNKKEIKEKVWEHHILLACDEIKKLKDLENSQILRCGFVSRDENSFYFSFDHFKNYFRRNHLSEYIDEDEIKDKPSVEDLKIIKNNIRRKLLYYF